MFFFFLGGGGITEGHENAKMIFMVDLLDLGGIHHRMDNFIYLHFTICLIFMGFHGRKIYHTIVPWESVIVRFDLCRHQPRQPVRLGSTMSTSQKQVQSTNHG